MAAQRMRLSGLGDVGADLLEGASFGLRDENCDENRTEQADDLYVRKVPAATSSWCRSGKV